MTRRSFLPMLPLAAAGSVALAQYSRPRPAKKDLPYLLEAGRLIATQVEHVTRSTTNKEEIFSVSGATSPARTPIPEPIFLFAPDQINPEQLGLYRFEVKEGRRQAALADKRAPDSDEEPLHLTLRKLAPNLFRIEAGEMLQPGEYALYAQARDTAFCFTVF